MIKIQADDVLFSGNLKAEAIKREPPSLKCVFGVKMHTGEGGYNVPEY
jgi:hypothetical protein